MVNCGTCPSHGMLCNVSSWYAMQPLLFMVRRATCALLDMPVNLCFSWYAMQFVLLMLCREICAHGISFNLCFSWYVVSAVLLMVCTNLGSLFSSEVHIMILGMKIMQGHYEKIKYVLWCRCRNYDFCWSCVEIQ